MNRSVYAYTKRNSLELVKYHRSVKFNTERSLRYFLIRGRKRGKLVTCRVGFTRSRRIDLVRSVRVTRVRRERRREMNTEKENGRIENIDREEREGFAGKRRKEARHSSFNYKFH